MLKLQKVAQNKKQKMIKTVTRRDGTKVPFDKKKIENAFVAAARESRSVAMGSMLFLPGKVVKAVMDSVGDKEEVSTAEIRTAVLGYLDKNLPKVSAAWREYDKKNKNI